METPCRILLLLSPPEESAGAVAFCLSRRLAKTQPVELYSDLPAALFSPWPPPEEPFPFFCHPCARYHAPPCFPVAVVHLPGRQGFRQLSRWAGPLKKRDYELYSLIRPFSPPALTPQTTVGLLDRGLKKTGLRLHGLIHCPPPHRSPQQSLDFVLACQEGLGVPVVLHAAPSAFWRQFSPRQLLSFPCLSLGEGPKTKHPL